MTPTTESLADVVLIKETLDGNSDAFGKLMEKYHPKFLGMATRMLGSTSEAEDVLQNAFIEAFRHLSGFQNRSRFSTWFYSIVINHISNRLRHNRVIQWVPIDTSVGDDYTMKPELPDNSLDVDVYLEQKFQIEAVREAIKSLPLQLQSIFILHYFDGLQLKEIAERLNRPLGTIKAYLHRARKLLQSILNSHQVINEIISPDLFIPKKIREEDTDASGEFLKAI